MSPLSRYLQGFRGFERDARTFLAATVFYGAALSLFWIDFNLFLRSLGLDAATIGLIATTGSAAGALVAFPASGLAERIGRRRVLLLGGTVMALALAGLAMSDSVPLIFMLAAAYAAGMQTVMVVSNPFLTDHSRPEHRSELFSLQFAVMQATQLVAALGGGIGATLLAASLGVGDDPSSAFRILLVLQTVLMVIAVLVFQRLSDDRAATRQRRAAVARDASAGRLARAGFRVSDRARFVRLLLPSLLVSLGAGQIIPFLNLYVSGRFGLDLSAVNGVFALTGLGTMLAILLQPAIARRYGRPRAVVLVQVASLPFLLALGFAPFLVIVVLAMAVRHSLMNAGNPLLNAFLMDQVPAEERGTLAAAQQVLWQGGWVVASIYYSAVQAALGFDAGYAVNFMTIICLYGVATALFWHWFRDADRAASPAPMSAGGREPALAGATRRGG